jgi:hypothetical protein
MRKQNKTTEHTLFEWCIALVFATLVFLVIHAGLTLITQ